MSIEVIGPVSRLGDEQLIRLHRQLKQEVEELTSRRTLVDDELKARLRAQTPGWKIQTPSGSATLITRHDRTYDPLKTFGILGTDRFMRVVTVSTTQLKALLQAEPLIDQSKLEGCYVETEIPVLQVR